MTRIVGAKHPHLQKGTVKIDPLAGIKNLVLGRAESLKRPVPNMTQCFFRAQALKPYHCWVIRRGLQKLDQMRMHLASDFRCHPGSSTTKYIAKSADAHPAGSRAVSNLSLFPHMRHVDRVNPQRIIPTTADLKKSERGKPGQASPVAKKQRGRRNLPA